MRKTTLHWHCEPGEFPGEVTVLLEVTGPIHMRFRTRVPASYRYVGNAVAGLTHHIRNHPQLLRAEYGERH